MAIELCLSDFEDPFRDCSLLSLLPQTLGVSLNAENPALETQELDSIQNVFRSMALKGSTQILEQAQTINNSYSNIQSLCSDNGDKAFAANGKDRPQGRRPALRRKRAQFSLRPVSSYSLPNVDVSSSIDHIEDPEEYFMAFEQLENAEKELKKLRGEISTDLTRHHQSTTARKRRPGLLGKTASYKHHFSANADNADALVESQEEPPDRRSSSASKTSIDMELSNALHSKTIDKTGTSLFKNTNSELQAATEREGSVADKEKKVDNLLEKLVSSFKNLDGDEGETLLRESLQMKSIDVGKICLPELGSIRRIDHSVLSNKVTRGELKGSQFPQTSPTLTKSPLAAVSTLRRRVSLKDSLNDLYSVLTSDDAAYSGDSSRSRGLERESLSPPDTDNHGKSGFSVDDASSPVVENGSLLSFNDKIHSSVVEADRFIGNKITLDFSVNDASSPVVENGSQLSFNDKIHSSVVEADRFISNKITLEEELIEHPPCSFEKNTDYDSSGVDNDKDDVSSGLDGGLQEEGKDMQLDPLITDQPDAGVEDLISGCINHSRTEGLVSPPSRNMGENFRSSGINDNTGLFGLDDTSQAERNATVQEQILDAEASKDSSSPSKATLLTNQHLENSCAIPEVNNEGHQTASGASLNRGTKQKAPPCGQHKQKSTSGRQSLADSSTPSKASLLTNQHLENLCAVPVENNEGHQTASGASLNRGTKQKTPLRRRNKQNSTSGRQSLADAGMIWKSGVRKSSRIKSRPLQYWRGERFLYGRIHDSLATVIGMKYESPGKDGNNPVLKVKSFVSDEYADLVAQAALH